MHSIIFAQWFIDGLKGRSCMISRRRCPKDIVRPDNYFTLHQIAFKVLRRTSSNLELSGELMFGFVQKAVQEVFQEIPSDETVGNYYRLIREHKNRLPELKSLPEGLKVLSQYQQYLSEGMDWEDSLQSANWVLKHKDVTSLYQFEFENIILVQPELLLLDNNRNALDFFLSLANWMEDYTRNNVFVVNNQGIVKKFEQGKFHNIFSLFDLIANPEASSSWYLK